MALSTPVQDGLAQKKDEPLKLPAADSPVARNNFQITRIKHAGTNVGWTFSRREIQGRTEALIINPDSRVLQQHPPVLRDVPLPGQVLGRTGSVFVNVLNLPENPHNLPTVALREGINLGETGGAPAIPPYDMIGTLVNVFASSFDPRFSQIIRTFELQITRAAGGPVLRFRQPTARINGAVGAAPLYRGTDANSGGFFDAPTSSPLMRTSSGLVFAGGGAYTLQTNDECLVRKAFTLYISSDAGVVATLDWTVEQTYKIGEVYAGTVGKMVGSTRTRGRARFTEMLLRVGETPAQKTLRDGTKTVSAARFLDLVPQ